MEFCANAPHADRVTALSCSAIPPPPRTALSSTVNLNVDLDVMLAVLAQALTAALRARLPGYAAATPTPSSAGS
jgi:hypothetical protein